MSLKEAGGGAGVASRNSGTTAGAGSSAAGVGAVATQSFVDPSYGKLGLDLMRAGKSAPDALKALLAGDAASDVRQVAMIDTQGRVAAHTGAKDIQAAGRTMPWPTRSTATAGPFAWNVVAPPVHFSSGPPSGSRDTLPSGST